MNPAKHVIVVTGASQGIGAAVARRFASESDTAIALVSRNRAALDAVEAECSRAGAESAVFVCDVTDEKAVSRMAAAVADRFGPPSAVVNNAGSFVPGGLLDTGLDQFRLQVDANLTSAFLVSRAFLPGMIETGRGHFFFMASVASIRGYAGGTAYCAAKHGMLGLARAIREETRTSGIRVTTLLPGATYTPSWFGSDEPEDRFMPAEDIAETLVQTYRLTGRTVVEEILLRPQLGDL